MHGRDLGRWGAGLSAFTERNEMDLNSTGSLIRKTRTGILGLEESVSLIHEIALLTAVNEDKHVLLDLQRAEVHADMGELIETAAECGRLLSDFPGKIAVVLPNCEADRERAKRLRACMLVQSFRYEHFQSREAMKRSESGMNIMAYGHQKPP